MRIVPVVLLAFLMALDPPGAAAAPAAGTATFLHAKDLAFGPAPPSLPAGARVAVLLGDPSADGPFVIRLMLPKGYRIPPHSHSRDEQVTVISGTMYLGMATCTSRAPPEAWPPAASTCCARASATSRTRSSRRSSR